MDIGMRIQRLLDEQGITQKKMAEDLHLSPNTINGYITKHRSVDSEKLTLIARYLNTSVDYLVGISQLTHYPDISLTPKEGMLLSHYRSVAPEYQRALEDMSTSLYKIELDNSNKSR